MNTVFQRLDELRSDLTEVECVIANYFIENMNVLVGTSITEIAQVCETSKASVLRLCKKLGYSGYKGFINALSAENAVDLQSSIADRVDVHPGNTVQEICEIVSRKNIRTLENTLCLVDAQTIENAAEHMVHARRIEFYGVGSSGIIAEDAALKFRRIGMNTFVSTDSHYQIMSAATLNSNDVVVLFSFQGETKDIIESAKIARERGATIITVTKYGKSAISNLSDIALFVSNSETTNRSSATASRLSMLMLIDIIFTVVISREYGAMRETLERTSLLLQNKRKGNKKE